MEMKFGLLADWAGETREGKLLIVGEFDTIMAPQVPVPHPSMAMVARMHANLAEGTEHALDVRLIGPSGDRLSSIQGHLRFVPGGPGRPLRGQIILQVVQLTLPDWGKYHFEIRVDGMLKDTVPFEVVRPSPA